MDDLKSQGHAVYWVKEVHAMLVLWALQRFQGTG